MSSASDTRPVARYREQDTTLIVHPGAVWTFEEFCAKVPPVAWAVDGLVPGLPRVAPGGGWASFDHHAPGVPALALRSTCEQVLVALLAGHPHRSRPGGPATVPVLHANHLDEDVAMCLWLIAHRDMVGTHPLRIRALVATEGTLDSTGGVTADPGPIPEILDWVFDPIRHDQDQRSLSETMRRITGWATGTATPEPPGVPAGPRVRVRRGPVAVVSATGLCRRHLGTLGVDVVVIDHGRMPGGGNRRMSVLATDPVSSVDLGVVWPALNARDPAVRGPDRWGGIVGGRRQPPGGGHGVERRTGRRSGPGRPGGPRRVAGRPRGGTVTAVAVPDTLITAAAALCTAAGVATVTAVRTTGLLRASRAVGEQRAVDALKRWLDTPEVPEVAAPKAPPRVWVRAVAELAGSGTVRQWWSWSPIPNAVADHAARMLRSPVDTDVVVAAAAIAGLRLASRVGDLWELVGSGPGWSSVRAAAAVATADPTLVPPLVVRTARAGWPPADIARVLAVTDPGALTEVFDAARRAGPEVLGAVLVAASATHPTLAATEAARWVSQAGDTDLWVAATETLAATDPDPRRVRAVALRAVDRNDPRWLEAALRLADTAGVYDPGLVAAAVGCGDPATVRAAADQLARFDPQEARRLAADPGTDPPVRAALRSAVKRHSTTLRGSPAPDGQGRTDREQHP